MFADSVTACSVQVQVYMYGLIWANVDSVFIQRTGQVQVWPDLRRDRKHSLKLREMQEAQEYAPTQVQRRGDRYSDSTEVDIMYTV